MKLKGDVILQQSPEKIRSTLQQSFEQFLQTLDSIEPENVDIDDIDHLIQMINELDEKCQQLKK